MLFSYKNHLWPTMVLWVALTSAAIMARFFFDLEWDLVFTPDTVRQVVFGLAVVVASDSLLHGGLWALFRDRYLHYYRALADYFTPQGPAEILAGGLLASAEEMIFRGVILVGIAEGLGWGVPAGVLIAAFLFALAHLIPTRRLAPFALWAFWEGLLLGLVYVLSGSLLVAMLVHALHDMAGFTLFAFQRRTGRFLYRARQPG
jgi:membrane protease YdiL (CAAX protease family)